MEIETLDVVAVGAHPDDIEITCGGTLAMLVKQGYRVGIIDLTDGEPTPHCPAPEVRIAEAQRAANLLGVHKRVILDLPNRRLFDTFEARVKLATEFRRYRPRVVIGFGDKTPTASPDHWQAMQITDAAVFYSRLTKWDDQFSGLAPHTIARQLYFGLPFDLGRPQHTVNEFFVDISQTLEQKLAAIKCYETQFAQKPDILKRVSESAVVAGMAAGFGAAESFCHTKAIGTSDLMGLLFGLSGVQTHAESVSRK
ncbi:MAG TPA: PIG-L family deacetylase [Pirellulaceae bacterium]|nr:PIG-L family deacetylase [Pirellulaceae bacterium]HMO93180.1 PIG-L family deacetylase [Pirellulaceae bacterium]HMP69991.1 PIG-L family deacetylase [Pirellulaceae bacterium]